MGFNYLYKYSTRFYLYLYGHKSENQLPIDESIGAVFVKGFSSTNSTPKYAPFFNLCGCHYSEYCCFKHKNFVRVHKNHNHFV